MTQAKNSRVQVNSSKLFDFVHKFIVVENLSIKSVEAAQIVNLITVAPDLSQSIALIGGNP